MTDDRTAKARLRDSAMELVAEGGVKALTARAVADRSGLSQGLIRHHYGSMAELLRACDAHIAEVIRASKRESITPSPSFDAIGALRSIGSDHVLAYLTRRLGADSPEIDALIDLLVADAVGYLRDGVDAGVVTPTSDLPGRAALATIVALGSLTMHRHLARYFEVDVRSEDLASQPGFARYVRAQLDLFSGVVEPKVLDEYLPLLEEIEEHHEPHPD